MPFYPSQEAFLYLDIETGHGIYFHADSGRLWSAKKLSETEIKKVRENVEYQNLN